jgi:hypothetical protein
MIRKRLAATRNKRVKYPGLKQLAESSPELSASDTRKLERLVRKYGRDAVATAVGEIEVQEPRGPGRPSRGLLPYYEKMHLADWIEDRAEEHRRAGSVKPYTNAEIDLYEMLYSGGEERRDLNKFRKTRKKARLQGRRDLQQLRERLQAQKVGRK